MKIGIIGGSGLEALNIFEEYEELSISTDYGNPSSSIFHGSLQQNKEVFIISRHGRNHQYSPSQVNNRANINALKKCGVTLIIATTACGSLREEIGTGHLVVPNQFIDFTKRRENTFYHSFENSGPVHTAMPDPFDEHLRQSIVKKAREKEHHIHDKATVITIEGPRFSTRAESKMFRSWGADIINMSTAPEAALANEANLKYAAIAISTDYDSWKENEKHATWEDIVTVFKHKTEDVKSLLAEIIKAL